MAMLSINDDIRLSTAIRMKKYLWPLKHATVANMCVNGVFKTAHKKGMGKNSPWFISGAEIIAHKINRHAVIQDS
jgi:hypothetical protein